jgi:hypothetical protein
MERLMAWLGGTLTPQILWWTVPCSKTLQSPSNRPYLVLASSVACASLIFSLSDHSSSIRLSPTSGFVLKRLVEMHTTSNRVCPRSNHRGLK